MSILVATTVAAATAAVVGHAPVSRAMSDANGAPGGVFTPVTSSAERPAMVLPDFSAIVDRYGPAVVNISVSGTVKTNFPQLDPDDPFSEFLRRFGGRPQGRVPTHGTGSGFIVDADGVILTNAHVVADADEVTVKLTDKREFKAKVVGVDKTTDVAVLRIAAKGLPTVAIGDPAQSRVGEWVVAIGSPFGFENSVTSGIVSAKSRSLPEEGYVPFLQTDVAINPGNSGGPLFNLKGEVIGINSQIYSRSGGYQGLSFAIPIDIAMKVERQLVEHGKVRRGRLGVLVQDVDQALADSFGLDRPAGALVSSVEEGGAAARAGLKPGDVVLSYNGQPIKGSNDLPPLVADTAPGTTAVLDIWRGGRRQSIHLTVSENADTAARAGGPDDAVRLGLALRPLTAEEKRAANLGGGLLVEDVTGPAARAGIQPGDIILAANGTGLATAEQLRALAAKAGKRVALLVQRGDSKLFVPVTLG